MLHEISDCTGTCMHNACIIAQVKTKLQFDLLQKIIKDLVSKNYNVHVYTPNFYSDKILNGKATFHDITHTEQLEETLASRWFRLIVTDTHYYSLAKNVINNKNFIISFEKFFQKPLPPIPQKILVLRFGAIGDVIHTTNTFRSIKNAYPEVQIDYLTFKTPAQLLQNDIYLNEVLIADKKDLQIFGSNKLINRLKSENYDLAINLQPSLKSRFLLHKAGIKNVATYKKDYNLHAVVNFWDTAKKVMPDIRCPYDLKIYLDKNISEQTAQRLSSFTKPFIAINAGGINSPRQGRCYPIEKWLETGIKLQGKYNGTIFITGLSEDKQLLSKLDKIPNSVNLTGKLSLQELASLYENCDLVLSGDSGPLHIATAVGTRVVGLFGSMKISRTGPYGFGHRTIKADLPCCPCNRRKCKLINSRHSTYQKCMEAIQLDDIANVAAKVLEERGY